MGYEDKHPSVVALWAVLSMEIACFCVGKVPCSSGERRSCPARRLKSDHGENRGAMLCAFWVNRATRPLRCAQTRSPVV